jgi:predicted dehydrogenase
VNVGIVGCGVVSRRYAKNARAFDSFEIVACADVDPQATEALASAHGYAPLSVDELIVDPSIELVLNLTPPLAHAALTEQALAAGKHVYSEKPLATTASGAAAVLAAAKRRGLRLGCAPDTFLSGSFQAARALLDAGGIGQPLSADAAVLVGGQMSWHPNPDIFYADGAGPLLDVGPYYLTALVALLGPVRRVAGFASTRVQQRTIAVGPRAGTRFTAETPTHTVAALELDRGVTATLTASFEAPGESVADFVIYGTEGALALPDPNTFGGPLRIRRRDGGWVDVPFVSRGAQDNRGIGLDDLVRALAQNRPHRASGELAAHVVEVARSILAAAADGRAVDVATSVERPAPSAVEAPAKSSRR